MNKIIKVSIIILIISLLTGCQIAKEKKDEAHELVRFELEVSDRSGEPLDSLVLYSVDAIEKVSKAVESGSTHVNVDEKTTIEIETTLNSIDTNLLFHLTKTTKNSQGELTKEVISDNVSGDGIGLTYTEDGTSADTYYKLDVKINLKSPVQKLTAYGYDDNYKLIDTYDISDNIKMNPKATFYIIETVYESEMTREFVDEMTKIPHNGTYFLEYDFLQE